MLKKIVDKIRKTLYTAIICSPPKNYCNTSRLLQMR